MHERPAPTAEAALGQRLASAQRSRSGYRPEWARVLSTIEHLTVAAFDLLSRDPDWQSRLVRLAAEQPACDLVSRSGDVAVAHVSGRVDAVHAACFYWLRDLAGFGHAIGCPSLEALLRQIELGRGLAAAGYTYRFGAGVVHPLSADVRRPARSRLGVIDRPAFLLLTRRWRREPGARAAHRTLVEVARMWVELQDDWLRDEVPDRREIAYPAYREWLGRRRSREVMRLAPTQRADAVAGWARGGGGADGAESSQAIRKGHARVERILGQAIPDLQASRTMRPFDDGRRG